MYINYESGTGSILRLYSGTANRETITCNDGIVSTWGTIYSGGEYRGWFWNVNNYNTDYVCVQVVADEVEGSAGYLKAKGVPLFVRFGNGVQQRRMIGNLPYEELVRITEY
jgi:hypothetical protein